MNSDTNQALLWWYLLLNDININIIVLREAKCNISTITLCVKKNHTKKKKVSANISDSKCLGI